MRKLNSRFLLLLVAALILVGAGTFAIHWFQSGSIAQGLLWQASRAESEGRLDQAAKYLGRYLEFRPKDTAERAHLAEILVSEKLAAPRRTLEHALFVFEQVLLKEPERHDSRRSLARLALKLGRPELAQEHLKILHKAKPDDGALELLQAQTHEAQNQLLDATAWYRKAVQHAPQQIDAHVRLAQLLRRSLEAGKTEALAREADAVMDRLVAQNTQDYRAYLARWRYRRTVGSAGRGDVDEALKLAPNEADVILAAAELAQEDKQFEQARTLLRRGLEQHAQDARFYQTLALVELRAERPEQAIAELKKGVQELRGQAQLDLLWTLANVYFDGKQVREAETVLAQLRQLNAAPATLDYLSARLLLAQGQWSEAARVLERTRPQIEGSAELARQVDQFLGQCYEQLVEPGRQLAVLQRVAQANPTSAPARLRLIAAHQAAGRAEEAILEYRELLKLPDAPANAWIDLARLLIARQSQREGRDWKEIEASLQKAAQASASADRLAIAQAELLAAQGKLSDARALLAKARLESKLPEVWIVSAALAERDGKPEEGQRLLSEAAQQCGDRVELRLAQLALATVVPGAGTPPVLEQTERDLPRFTDMDYTRLLYGLAETHYRLGRRADAQRLWGQLADQPLYRNDLRIRLFLFDLSLHANDQDGMSKALAHIERIDTQQGAFVRYCLACRLIAQARSAGDSKAGLEEARAHLDAAAAQRPNWSALLLAKGDLEQMQNNPKQALAHYRRAHELGERHPRFVRRLVEMLHREQQFGEAERLLGTMQQAALTPDMQRLLVETLMRSRDPGRALSLLGQLRLGDSADYRDHLWLGQVLSANNPRAAEVEQHFRKAVELGGEVAETWVALVQHLARLGKKTDAEAALAAMKARLKPEQLPLTLAQCHDVLGNFAAAREQYQAMLTARPDDVAVVRAVAGFYLRWNRAKEAEPLLRSLAEGKVKAAAPEAAWACRGLAMILAASGDYRQLPKAFELVGLRLDGAGNLVEESIRKTGSFEERYAQARVLATQPRRSFRTKAVALLEDLHQRHGLQAEDQFVLARLFEAEDTATSRAKAREVLRRLATTQGTQPAYVAAYVHTLLRHNQLDEAKQILEALVRLEKSQQLEPGTYSSVELQARLFEARGEGAKAVTLLEEYVGRTANKPEKVFVLVETLARLKRTREALDRCESAWQSCPPEMTAAACLGVLRMGQPQAADWTRVEKWLETALQKNTTSVALRMHLARLYEMQEQYTKAEPIYRAVLERDPDNVVALNNLAWLLAQDPTRSAEALVRIRRAIEIMGPTANLLDTRGCVYITQKNADLAIADLEAATADAPNPPGFFRLARAQFQAQRSDAALIAFQKAKAAGLDPRQLHPVERDAYVQMARTFEQR